MRKITTSLAMAFALALPVTAIAMPEAGTSETRILDRPFLELLGYLEGPDGYDDVTGFTNRETIKPVTRMSIDEVLDFQRMIRQEGAKSSAMGRYQFIYKTLLHLTEFHGIDRSKLFDRRMQDLLARLEMARCGFYETSSGIGPLGDCLAESWAALPLLTGNDRGRSRYVATGINAARTSPEVVEAILKARTVDSVSRVAVKRRASGFRVSGEAFGGHAEGIVSTQGQVPAPQVDTATKGTATAPSASLRPVAR